MANTYVPNDVFKMTRMIQGYRDEQKYVNSICLYELLEHSDKQWFKNGMNYLCQCSLFLFLEMCKLIFPNPWMFRVDVDFQSPACVECTTAQDFENANRDLTYILRNITAGEALQTVLNFDNDEACDAMAALNESELNIKTTIHTLVKRWNMKRREDGIGGENPMYFYAKYSLVVKINNAIDPATGQIPQSDWKDNAYQLLVNEKMGIYASLRALRQNDETAYLALSWPDFRMKTILFYIDFMINNNGNGKKHINASSYLIEGTEVKEVVKTKVEKPESNAQVDFSTLSKKQLANYSSAYQSATGKKTYNDHEFEAAVNKQVKAKISESNSTSQYSNQYKGGSSKGGGSKGQDTTKNDNYCAICAKLGWKGPSSHPTEKCKREIKSSNSTEASSSKASANSKWASFDNFSNFE